MATAAQIAARKTFADMARAGAFKKKPAAKRAAVKRNPVAKKVAPARKRNPVDFGAGGGTAGVKANETELRKKVEQLSKALGLPAWPNGGAIGLDKAMYGYQLVQHSMTSSGERELSSRLKAGELLHFLAGAIMVAKATKS